MLLKRSKILRHLKEAGEIAESEVRHYYFPEKGVRPFDEEIIDQHKPNSTEQVTHAPYSLPGFPVGD